MYVCMYVFVCIYHCKLFNYSIYKSHFLYNFKFFDTKSHNYESHTENQKSDKIKMFDLRNKT